jgi:mRNA interferase ChpB
VGVARCDQPRVLDLVARKAKKLESVSADVMDEVLAKLATLIS